MWPPQETSNVHSFAFGLKPKGLLDMLLKHWREAVLKNLMIWLIKFCFGSACGLKNVAGKKIGRKTYQIGQLYKSDFPKKIPSP